jgi:hypothetical protein
MSNVYWLRRGSEEFCGIDSKTRDTCQLAIDGDEAALNKLHPSTLDEALKALDSCRIHDCEEHRDESDARRLLDRVYFAELERDRPEWLGEPICADCSGGCRACLGIAQEVV